MAVVSALAHSAMFDQRPERPASEAAIGRAGCLRRQATLCVALHNAVSNQIDTASYIICVNQRSDERWLMPAMQV
ncbi:hypothetical protein AC628_22485 [Bradyrhizobium sp. NAS96.2]|nr:hypothetical protein AC628_22485 [Bradyrhizobium sp. NAS96.2]